MDLEGIESFLTVAHTKSISKAAASLHITQPTLSTRIRKLEESLGYILLERSWEGVRLSNQGYYFLPYAIQLLRELSNASTVLTDFNVSGYETTIKEITHNNKDFKIGINSWLAPVFTKTIISVLSKHFPNLEYKFVTRPTNILKELIHYDGIHLGIYYQNEKKTNFYHRSLIEDEMVLICSDEDSAIIQNNIDHVHKLEKPYLLFDNPILANNTNMVNSILSRLNINKFQVVDDFNVMITYLTSGKGYIILPRTGLFQLPNFPTIPIKMIPLGEQLPSLGIHLGYNKSNLFMEQIKIIEQELSTFFKKENVS
ncbi:LysR family transcriptional regulator [Rossellomorea sp. BNER]|uniref:LysR family transcriptional regulator n=1 Tax=Rossellomorea sp. BNER TaxID=2962031 RepID=UPI003AF23595|nr:LysR family transcriptional regulator [Rossellomorea sp. BNER]